MMTGSEALESLVADLASALDASDAPTQDRREAPLDEAVRAAIEAFHTLHDASQAGALVALFTREDPAWGLGATLALRHTPDAARAAIAAHVGPEPEEIPELLASFWAELAPVAAIEALLIAHEEAGMLHMLGSWLPNERLDSVTRRADPLLIALAHAQEPVADLITRAFHVVAREDLRAEVSAVQALGLLQADEAETCARSLWARCAEDSALHWARELILQALFHLGAPGTSDLLTEALAIPAHADAASWALARLGDEGVGAVAPLISAWADDDAMRLPRHDAVRVATRHPSALAIETLGALIQDRDQAVRHMARATLARQGDATLLALLERELDEEDELTRDAAREVLATHTAPHAGELLRAEHQRALASGDAYLADDIAYLITARAEALASPA